MKRLIWWTFLAFVGGLICSDVKISASLYEVKDNWIEIHFPRAEWVGSPWWSTRIEPSSEQEHPITWRPHR